MAPRAFDTDRIGPYRILYASDGAGMTSFVAREEGPVGFQRDVVLKIVPEGDPERVADARELAQEATLGSRLNHPNIVRNHDFFAQDGRLVLVQEHVDGVTLAELLSALRERTERLSDAAALTIGVAVLEALAHAHALVDGSGARSPVAHRRIVPAAIALGRDGAVKLGGFSATPLATDLVSSVGAAPGFAPAADDSGERSDVHAAGRLLWQLLTGREPGADLEPLAVLRADLPRELCAAVSAALDVTASKRAIGCAELASWIKKVARLAGGRDELRERVTAVARVAPMSTFAAPAGDPSLGEITGESARIPLAGWTVRLAPIANRVLSGPAWSRAGARVRDRLMLLGAEVGARAPKLDAFLRAHRRASIAVAAGAVGATVVLALALGRSHHSALAHVVPLPPPVPVAHASISSPTPAAPGAQAPAGPATAFETMPADKSAPTPGSHGSHAKLAALEHKDAPSNEKAAPAPVPAAKMAYAVPGAAPKSVPPPPKGFGYLTVHSSIGYAFVYVQLARYGHVERRLTVRCGKRFLSVGIPKATGGEPTWFAPSRTVDVPCGSEVEVTMMPKWIP